MSDQPNLNYQNELSPYTNFIVKDVALKALLFSMVFYIMNSNLINKLLQCLDKYQFIEKNQAEINSVEFLEIYPDPDKPIFIVGTPK